MLYIFFTMGKLNYPVVGCWLIGKIGLWFQDRAQVTSVSLLRLYAREAFSFGWGFYQSRSVVSSTHSRLARCRAPQMLDRFEIAT
jgi:hypothetical protein